MEIILLFVLFWYGLFRLRKKIIFKTTNSNPIVKTILRALMSTLCFGIGIVGVPGFALPGPLFAALIIYNNSRTYLYTAILPFVIFFFLFVLINIITIYIEKRKANQTESR